MQDFYHQLYVSSKSPHLASRPGLSKAQWYFSSDFRTISPGCEDRLWNQQIQNVYYVGT